MNTTSKKYKVQGDVAYPHIGSYLAQHFAKDGINRNELARQMGVANSTTTSYMKRQSLQFGILWKISLALKYNFIADLGSRLPIEFVSARERELEMKLEALQQEINELKIENRTYKEVLLNK
jgi:hypothetical protein